MKPGRILTVLLIMLLIVAGCGRKEKTNLPERNKIENILPITCFQDIKADDQTNREIQLADREPSPYYIPEYPLDGMSSLSSTSPGIQIFNNKIRKYGVDPCNQCISPILLKAGITSPDIFFTAIFDNDIIDYTDHYFTNGAGFELYHPFISSLPFTKLLPGLKYSTNFYGLALIQNMYTPLKLNKPEILVGDRPFAAYLALSHQRISMSTETKRRLYTEFTIGVIGPGAMGNFAQDMIHDETPTGWQYQVKNDFIANYNLRFDQGIYSGQAVEVAVVGGIQAGTLYDNISAGVYFQVGNANDRYASIFQTTNPQKPLKKRIRYYFSLDLSNKLIVYDATLQGGMFNNESAYTISPDNIKRYIFTGAAGFGIGLGKYSLEADQVFLTPEFDGGMKHMWFRIKNIIRLN
jgi:lipid A 3-O-deacylase